MDSSLLSQKYMKLLSELNTIKSKLDDLSYDYDLLYSFIKSNLLVDGEVFCSEDFEEIKKTNTKIFKEVTNDLIPLINKKL